MRLLRSARFWSALLGLAAIIAVQYGVSEEFANKITLEVTAIVGLLIAGYTVRDKQ